MSTRFDSQHFIIVSWKDQPFLFGGVKSGRYRQNAL